MLVATLCAGNSFGLELARIKLLSDYQVVENQKRLDSVVTYNYTEVDSIRTYKYEYAYDAIGGLISEAFFVWDSKLNQWQGSIIPVEGFGKPDYDYEESGYHHLWSEFNSLSELIDLKGVKEETIFDDNGNLILKILFKWDSELNEWVNYRKYECIYDERGNNITDIRYDWDSALNRWIEFRKYEYVCDDTGDQTIDARFAWNCQLNEWILDQKSFYYYFLPFEVFDPIFDENIVHYPNPTSGIINIIGLTEPAEVKLYTPQGQIVKTIKQAANFIDISDLQPGIYILNLQVGYQIMAWRVMKQ